MATAISILRAIAASPNAMGCLDAIPMVEARPPTTNDDGTLVVDEDGNPVDVGAPARSLADLVWDQLGGN